MLETERLSSGVGIAGAEVEPRPIMPFIAGDNRHVISVTQFTPHLLPELFKLASELRARDSNDDAQRELAQEHIGRRIAVTFYEASTRTDFSFRTAAIAMGIGVVHTNAGKVYSSAAKGETVEDTARTLDEFGYKAVIIRHGDEGSLARAALASRTPIINAGDGPGEHPTQALLDAYTIYDEFGSLEDKTIVFGGDLRYGRTVNSLVQLLSRYPGNRLILASVPELRLSDNIKSLLDRDGTPFTETDEIEDALSDSSIDVVYWTRTQKERHVQPSASVLARAASMGARALRMVHPGLLMPEVQGGFILNPDTIRNLPAKARIMHPLPRVDEIDEAIDDDPRSIYFRKQVGNGLYVRMALIDDIIRNTPRR